MVPDIIPILIKPCRRFSAFIKFLLKVGIRTGTSLAITTYQAPYLLANLAQISKKYNLKMKEIFFVFVR